MPDVPHQPVADAITDTAQVAAERPPADRDDQPMNEDDEAGADPALTPLEAHPDER